MLTRRREGGGGAATKPPRHHLSPGTSNGSGWFSFPDTPVFCVRKAPFPLRLVCWGEGEGDKGVCLLQLHMSSLTYSLLQFTRMWKAPLQVVSLLLSTTLPWGLLPDVDQSPQWSSLLHKRPHLATAEPLPLQHLQAAPGNTGVKAHYWKHLKEKGCNLTKSLTAQWLLCPRPLP